MQIHNNTLIAECSSYDFKEMLERKKVKSWLKSVSAFANTDGGSLFYGVNDEGVIVGLENPQADADFISEMIKARLDPVPEVQLIPIEHEGRNLLEVRVKAGTLTPYYYYTSSIYKGECTSSRVGLMTAKNSDTPLYLVKINGEQVYELVKKYLTEADENFYVTTKYELPIASGMKIIVKNEENGFSLKDITINDKKIDTEKEYSILLTDTTKSILKKINPKCAIEQIGDTTLSSAWIAAMSNGQQPSAPEDYIEVEK